MESCDFETKRAQKEYEISEFIRADNGCTTYFTWSVSFDPKPGDGRKVMLTVQTYNPVHRTKFLLIKKEMLCPEQRPPCSVYETILDEVLTYVRERKTMDFNYQVEWNLKNSDEPIKRSYFNGKDVDTVLQKLYEAHDRDLMIIYSISMLSEA
jgi:hypothetical protein